MTTGASGSSNDSPKKKGWPKGRKRRLRPKDTNAPKGPLSGYMLFMSDQREILRQTNAGLAFHEITKLVAQRWAQLDTPAKTKYLEAAEADKERYQKELEEYQKTDAYKNFLMKQRKEETPTPPKKQRKETVDERKPEEEEEIISPHAALEIPIFTEEFLNHNKAREAELRQLRKSNTDYEEQNAILQKHIESMKMTVEKLESETSQQRSNNAALLLHIESLRQTLAKAFMSLPLPDPEDANEGNETPDTSNSTISPTLDESNDFEGFSNSLNSPPENNSPIQLPADFEGFPPVSKGKKRCTQETPTKDSIDNYMVQLHSLIVNNPQQHQGLIQTVRGIVSQLALT